MVRSAGKPLLVLGAGDGGGRLFVVNQLGTIQVVKDGGLVDFLDVSAHITDTAAVEDSEQGLLGLAFHPAFRANGRLFVNYTDRDGHTRIDEYRATGDRADPSTRRELAKIEQPYPNHNGGHLIFGPDGKLWIGTGDGGSRNDPQGNAQNPASLLGKMLVLDVDAAQPKLEIVARGLRNPWRYAFDPVTKDLFIADVGQNKYEEVHVVPGGRAGAAIEGLDFGWDEVEGMGHCTGGSKTCDQSGKTAPVVEYTHDEGCSITGGWVYRGKALPALAGAYFYADYCSALIRSFRWDGAVKDHWDWRPVLDPGSKLARISSFGLDDDGELYIVTLDGNIWKLVAAP